MKLSICRKLNDSWSHVVICNMFIRHISSCCYSLLRLLWASSRLIRLEAEEVVYLLFLVPSRLLGRWSYTSLNHRPAILRNRTWKTYSWPLCLCVTSLKSRISTIVYSSHLHFPFFHRANNLFLMCSHIHHSVVILVLNTHCIVLLSICLCLVSSRWWVKMIEIAAWLGSCLSISRGSSRFILLCNYVRSRLSCW